jgi:hypothetical protein
MSDPIGELKILLQYAPSCAVLQTGVLTINILNFTESESLGYLAPT